MSFLRKIWIVIETTFWIMFALFLIFIGHPKLKGFFSLILPWGPEIGRVEHVTDKLNRGGLGLLACAFISLFTGR